jgi:hypothetical protein
MSSEQTEFGQFALEFGRHAPLALPRLVESPWHISAIMTEPTLEWPLRLPYRLNDFGIQGSLRHAATCLLLTGATI